MKTNRNFSGLIEAFFTDRLMRQRQASPATICSYRDAFCRLFQYVKTYLKISPSKLRMEDLNSKVIADFLCWLENQCGNSTRTRNARLAAIHSFFKYALLYDPLHAGRIQQILAIPNKRFDRVSVEYLMSSETKALLSAPDLTSSSGRRDRALLLLAVQTGLRVSEIISLNCGDIVINGGAHVKCKGKGRKERCTPISKNTNTVLGDWLKEYNGQSTDPLFPNARGGRLSRDGVEYLLQKHVKTATQICPTLKKKRISPHVLRHTAAMDLLQHGVDRTVIAMWLGHENLETVNIYLHANLKMKEEALAKTSDPSVLASRFKPEDELMAFLKNL